MPQGASYQAVPGGPFVSGTTIPYPSTTATGTVDFTQFALGSLQLTPGQLDTRIWTSGSGISPRVHPGFTGAWVELYNDSDSYLNITWDHTSINDICPPHHQRPIPIPVDEHSFHWSIQYQNLIEAPSCSQMLTCFFIDQVSLAAGAPLREGPINPPMPAAAGIGPGTLPPGVIVPGSSITSPIKATEVDIEDALAVTNFWAIVSSGPSTFQINRSTDSASIQYGPSGGLTLINGTGATNIATDTTGDFTTIAEVATTGYGVPLQVVQTGTVHISVTTLQTLVNFTPPATQPTYRISGDLDMAGGGGATVTLELAYNDVRGVARTVFFTTYTGVTLNAAVLAVGDYPLNAITIIGVFNTANVVITYQNSTGTPNDRISLFVERLV